MTTTRTYITALIAIFFAGLVIVILTTDTGSRVMPQCMEDAAIIGVGDFHSDGRWTSYVCGPAFDDIRR